MHRLTVLVFATLSLLISPFAAYAQEPPELLLTNEPFDRQHVEQLIKQLEAPEFDARQSAGKELRGMLRSSGYPLWYFLMNIDIAGSDRAETRARLESILKVMNVKNGITYTMKDWSGKPLANALCECYEMPGIHYKFDRRRGKLIGRTATDELGRIQVPDLNRTPDILPQIGKPQPPRQVYRGLGVVVYAPEYGAAGTMLTHPTHSKETILPLTKNGSKEAVRSARGIVVDEEGKPIPGAAIHAGAWELAGRGHYNADIESVVYADHKGRFRVYSEPRRVNSRLPVGAKLQLHVHADDFFPAAMNCGNEVPRKVVVKRGKSFHQFAFRCEDVPKTNLGVTVTYRPTRSTQINLSHHMVANGGKLLPGTYHAEFRDTRGNHARFTPVVVKADSPKLLEFHLPEAKTYKGRVVDGITGEPVHGAIVFGAYSSKSKLLVDITDEQLADLQIAPIDELETHATTDLLREVKGVVAITKTDKLGSYSVTLDPRTEIYGFYSVGPEVVPTEVRAIHRDKLKKDENPVLLHDMFRFPAARVQFTPKLPNEKQNADSQRRVQLWPEWRFKDEGQPEWFSQFKTANDARHGLPGFYPAFYWVPTDGKQTLIVPAHVQTELFLRNEQFGPYFFPDSVSLKPGETRDLGEIQLQRTVPVSVMAVGPNDEPVEGVAIRHLYDREQGWHIGRNTDATGTATIFVAEGLAGKFGVLDLQGPNGRVRDKNLQIPFKYVAGNAGQVYKIRLTQEQVDLIPEEGPE